MSILKNLILILIIWVAISELVGDEFHVNIKKLDFNFDNMGFGGDSCSLQLSIENCSYFDDDIPF